VLTLLLILIVGGCLALVGATVNSTDKAITRHRTKAGGTNSPISVVPGRAFEIDKIKYRPGWKIGKDALGLVQVTRLRVTNTDSQEHSIFIEIKLMKASEIIAVSDCSLSPCFPAPRRGSCAPAPTSSRRGTTP